MVQKKKKRRYLPLGFLIGSFMAFIITLVSYPYVKDLTLPCANSRSCRESQQLKVDNGAVGIFQNQPVSVPAIDLSQKPDEKLILGEQSQEGEKHIYVNLDTQLLTAYEDNKLFMQTPISSGLWGRTPKGDFDIWIKLRSTTMSGGSGNDYYNLPNVPYVMFFSNDRVPASTGFSLHGTYWHNNFGHKMSHGCVNMKTTDIAKLYEWANPKTSSNITRASKNNPGTKVTIF
ncbi:hypothetical protein A3J15_02880 [Candidatus Roizmanbacteria bacterium RIFCSPLOWO2_02_FULL_38_10]|uniref:L,D-TPase catalytic domain-containing protein n=1 Tax=Candidatus Roizmanbacteria bacterium RIFCSPLOWO2_02_FULL_38_10 TaxID=1802074 RepID=A0A1F7JKM8_9BACT|nr:MAG: hypothetical protein A3J15_02880 [Candidatus Roizmanbacteria bacterium RIFCSPLOWO2_02_FULL_38_10]